MPDLLAREGHWQTLQNYFNNSRLLKIVSWGKVRHHEVNTNTSWLIGLLISSPEWWCECGDWLENGFTMLMSPPLVIISPEALLCPLGPWLTSQGTNTNWRFSPPFCAAIKTETLGDTKWYPPFFIRSTSCLDPGWLWGHQAAVQIARLEMKNRKK